jgi:hypothetical protein
MRRSRRRRRRICGRRRQTSRKRKRRSRKMMRRRRSRGWVGYLHVAEEAEDEHVRLVAGLHALRGHRHGVAVPLPTGRHALVG